MRNSKEYLKKLANRIILETLEEKADSVMAKIKNAPTSFDYVAEGETCECGSPEFYEGECVECGKMSGEVMEKLYGKQSKVDKNKNGRLDSEDFQMLRKERNESECMECGNMKGEYMEGDVCECGSSNIYEGQCMECGELVGGKDSEILEFGTGDSDFTAGMSENELREKWEGNVKVKKTGEYEDKSISDLDSKIRGLKDLSRKYQESGKKVPKQVKEKMSELYFAKRSKKGWPGKGKVDVDEEMEEGNAFTGALARTKKGDDFEFNGKKYKDTSNLEETLYRLFDGDSSALFTENEVIDLIESIVKEEKEKNEDNITKGKEPKGLSKYNKVHKESGKENDEYLKSVVKKFTDYLKPGSKGKYKMDADHFPKGNGELAKMDKKAYEVSTDGDEFIDDYLRPGMQTLDYDEMHPNEEWMDDIIQGSSRTGNSQEWGNAEKTEVNKNLNKTRKKGAYNKAKRKAYNKAPQPVISDKPGQESGKGLHLDMKESINEKETLKLNEEFDRMKQLMGYSQKTQ
jgi:hypothetical protein